MYTPAQKNIKKYIVIYTIIFIFYNIFQKNINQNNISNISNHCISFSIDSDTGCTNMANYCSQHLHTNKFYFTDVICYLVEDVYVGNPLEGNIYTCCKAPTEPSRKITLFV